MTTTKPIVLYVEDEEMDRFLMERAFAKAGLREALRMVSDGQAAVDYLSRAGEYPDSEDNPLPDVVLLDLNLPEFHGFEVLNWIRMHPVFHNLPVVVFSSSERDEDQSRAKQIGANDFVKKPGSGLGFAEVVQKLNADWLCPAAAPTPASQKGLGAPP